MIDNKTVHLNLPLPHESNLLTEDVPRLREAFESLDAHAAQLETELSETLTAALAAAADAAKKALWAGIPDKPATFPPATHGHGWDEVSGKPGSFPPETHNHDGTYAAEGHGHSSITGNAATATKLQTARTISLTGDVTGSASFNGAGNVSISAKLKTGVAPSNGMAFYMAAGFPAAPTVV